MLDYNTLAARESEQVIVYGVHGWGILIRGNHCNHTVVQYLYELCITRSEVAKDSQIENEVIFENLDLIISMIIFSISILLLLS